jgi:hypothetical protein
VAVNVAVRLIGPPELLKSNEIEYGFNEEGLNILLIFKTMFEG